MSQDNPIPFTFSSGIRLEKPKLNGLYAITPSINDPETLCVYARQVAAGGARVLQYRDKSSDSETRLACARKLRARCELFGALLIINDDVELALQSGADGVHLGIEDGDVKQARETLGGDVIIGVSCYNDLQRAEQAVEQGADYLAFGSMYPSATKPDAPHCDPQVLTEARSLGLPVVAIGGITVENAPALVQAGADMLAVISDLANAVDVESRAQQYAQLWPETS